MNLNRRVGLVLILASIVAFSGFAYALISTITVSNSGSVSQLKLFWDDTLLNPVTVISWETLGPDTANTKIIWLKNTGESVLTLSLHTTNWSPVDGDDYLSVSWDREGATIEASGVLGATVTLTVHSNVTESTIGPFSYDMVIEGTA